MRVGSWHLEWWLRLEPHDLWVGAFWDFERGERAIIGRLFVCVLPMLPLCIRWSRPV